MTPRRVCLVALLGAALLFCAASAGRQDPDAVGEADVTDPQLSKALADAKAAAGKPRLFHENLVKERPLVQPEKWWVYRSGQGLASRTGRQ